MVTLEPLSEKNFAAVTRLEVAFDQAGFVAPNVLSIAESKVFGYLVPRVICRDGRPMGFALYGQDPETQRYYIVRLMIGSSHQGQGLGRAAVCLLVSEILSAAGGRSIFLSLVPGNERARRLYEGLGFEATGEVDEDGEVIYRLDELKAARLRDARDWTRAEV